MSTKKETAAVSTKEVAERINSHLLRFEADRKGINASKDGREGGLRPYYHAGAYSRGTWVRVCYVRYQGSTAITKSDAIKYLSKLDAGYVGRHFEALRQT